MHKVKHKMVPGYFENIFQRNDLKPYNLRNSDFIPDDDRIVSHNAPRLGLYYRYVGDIIIY